MDIDLLRLGIARFTRKLNAENADIVAPFSAIWCVILSLENGYEESWIDLFGGDGWKARLACFAHRRTDSTYD